MAVMFSSLRKYDEIYMYNDYSEIGIYLMCSNIRYHLLEDGLDVFKQFNVYENIGKGYYIKKLLFKMFKIPYTFGMTKQCIDIEINDGYDLKTNIKHKLIIVNRKKLEEDIDTSFLRLIFKVFEAKDINMNKKKVIILTQVLKEILVVKDEKQKFDYYKGIVSKYCDKYRVYLKPHPRDNINYELLERDYGVICLDKSIPMEVYSRLPGMYFDLAITYSSTAVNGRRFADKIVRLDNKIYNMYY